MFAMNPRILVIILNPNINKLLMHAVVPFSGIFLTIYDYYAIYIKINTGLQAATLG
jgi:hypothetical protein